VISCRPQKIFNAGGLGRVILNRCERKAQEEGDYFVFQNRAGYPQLRAGVRRAQGLASAFSAAANPPHFAI
jgi:hypothetical protein